MGRPFSWRYRCSTKSLFCERRLDHPVAAGRARSTVACRLDRSRIPRGRVPFLHEPAIRARPHQRRRQRLQAHPSLRECVGTRLHSAALLSPGPRRCRRTGVDGESAAQQLLDQHRSRRARPGPACARAQRHHALSGARIHARDSKGQPVENRSGRCGARWRHAADRRFRPVRACRLAGQGAVVRLPAAGMGPGRPHAGAQGGDPGMPLWRLCRQADARPAGFFASRRSAIAGGWSIPRVAASIPPA